MYSKGMNANLTPNPDMAADISASTADPAVKIPPIISQVPLPSSIIYMLEPAVAIPLNPDQVPLSPSVVVSYVSATAWGSSSGRSARASRHQQT